MDVTLLANNSQDCWMLHVAPVCTPCYMLLHVVYSCYAKFEIGQTLSSVQTDGAKPPKIVGPTMLGVAAYVCTEL